MCRTCPSQVPLGASAAAVEKAVDWHVGDSGNASLRDAGGDRAATGAPTQQNATIIPRLKNKSSVVYNEVTGRMLCAF